MIQTYDDLDLIEEICKILLALPIIWLIVMIIFFIIVITNIAAFKEDQKMLKTYFVRTTDVSKLQNALGRIIEYAKFLEDETGRSYPSFVDQIIEEDDILLEVQDV